MFKKHQKSFCLSYILARIIYYYSSYILVKILHLLIEITASALLITSRPQAAVLAEVHQHPYRNKERKRKILKDEKKHHGAVYESSSEQQFRKSDTITWIV